MIDEALTLTVNGERYEVSADPTTTLLEVLRGELELFGAREGCGVGLCGACTVLADGAPISSCLLPVALARDRALTTIEGVEGPGGELDVVQQAFIDCTAFQCAFCTAGFVLTTKALLEERPDVGEEEARTYLAGNLCRCGCYVKILEAVLLARDRLRERRETT